MEACLALCNGLLPVVERLLETTWDVCLVEGTIVEQGLEEGPLPGEIKHISRAERSSVRAWRQRRGHPGHKHRLSAPLTGTQVGPQLARLEVEKRVYAWIKNPEPCRPPRALVFDTRGYQGKGA